MKTTPAKKSKPAKLFHTVVIVGAAMVGCPGNPMELATRGESGSESSAAPSTCPPGSERPYPPCYWIK